MNSLRSRSSLFGVYMLHNDKEILEIKITDLQERIKVEEEKSGTYQALFSQQK